MKKEGVSYNSSGVASVVFGVLGVVFSIFVLPGIIFGVLATIFGFVQKRNEKNCWSTSGIVLGIVAILLSLVIMAALNAFVTNANQILQTCTQNPAAPGCEGFSNILPQSAYGN